VRHCVFCGYQGKLHNEHAWPHWIREVLPDGHVKGYATQHQIAVGTGKVTEATPTLRVKAADREVKVVCRTCNGGWMSDLENAAKPLLKTLILGEPPNLSESNQTLIAFWAAKTAMMLQFLHPLDIRGVPAAHYQHVYTEKAAPPTMRIWLSAASDRFYRTAHYTRGRRLPKGRELLLPASLPMTDQELRILIPPNVYSTVMVIGQLVISLVGWTLTNREFSVAPKDAWAPTRRCIWPPRPGGWAWPPDVVLGSLLDIERFAAAATA
jgi:hypothetical protein